MLEAHLTHNRAGHEEPVQVCLTRLFERDEAEMPAWENADVAIPILI
jgi:hypothetical protein